MGAEDHIDSESRLDEMPKETDPRYDEKQTAPAASTDNSSPVHRTAGSRSALPGRSRFFRPDPR
jgi:hypothetical protein